MEKLTFEQIIQKLKEADVSLEDFAFEEVAGEIDDYPEALEAQKIREEFKEKHKIPGTYSIAADKLEEYGNLPNEYHIAKTKFREGLGLNWQEVDHYGGEGKGETWYSVKYFSDHDIYIRVDGFYTSYEGVNFYGGYEEHCKEVRPKEKTITVYE